MEKPEPNLHFKFLYFISYSSLATSGVLVECLYHCSSPGDVVHQPHAAKAVG